MKNEKKMKKRGFGRVAIVMAVIVAFMVTIFPQKVKEAQAAEKKIIGYGTLNASWVNLGLNWNMTGGTSGKVVKGETFVVYEQKKVNNTNRYYVYAEKAKIYGYISERFIHFTPVAEAKKEAIGYGTLNASWVNLGLNWYMTGGTSGRVVPGETFIIYDQKVVNGTTRYYVYAENAKIYGYISERFITLVDRNEPADTQESKSEETVKERMDKLVRLLSGKYFTVNQKACCKTRVSGHGNNCSNCCVSNIIKTKWFRDMFGTISLNQLPKQDVNGSRRVNNGYSCFGFVCFAQQYVFADKNTDAVTAKKVASGTFTKDFITKNVKPGDVLRIANSHSVLVYEVSNNGVTVIDSNWNMGGQLNCIVQKHTIPYSSSTYGGTVTYVNRVVE